MKKVQFVTLDAEDSRFLFSNYGNDTTVAVSRPSPRRTCRML